MFYTRKGDDGTTKTLKSNGRILKCSDTIEALGCVDEINSFLGLCKIKSMEANLGIEEIIYDIQNNLFIIQAELAGCDKTITIDKVTKLEKVIDELEIQIPPITHFILSGGSEVSALFDIARTLSRKTERNVISAIIKEQVVISNDTKSYLNRLSSVLYALARFSNYKLGVPETGPKY